LRIASREWRRVAVFALFILIVTSIPYALAWSRQGEAWRFSGFLFGVEDGNSYLGKMRLGMRGEWEFTLFYTPEIHRSEPLVVLPYIAAGQLAGLFVPESSPDSQAALVITYHLMRLVCTALLIASMYLFIAQFLRARSLRLFALALATLGGGFGWLLSLIGLGGWLSSLPPDMYVPEGFSFLIIFGLPHLALARAALLWGLVLLIKSQRKDAEPHPPAPPRIQGGEHSGKPASNAAFFASLRLRAFALSLFAGVSWLVVGLAVPFYLAVIYAILGAWGLAAWVRLRRFPGGLFWRCVVAGGVTLPLFGYNTFIFLINEAFSQWSAQNNLPSPHPLHYLVAYALLLVPALAGFRWAWHRARRQIAFALPVGWLLIVPILVYLPINVQRRLSEAAIVPLAILATMGLRLLLRQGRTRRRTQTAYLIAASLTTIFLLFGATLAALSPRTPLFRPSGEVAAFNWLNWHTSPDDVVFAAVPTGNALPAFVRARTYMGHGPETLDWPTKTDTVERFYRGELNDDEFAALFHPPCRDSAGLCLLPVHFIFYGEAERALSPDIAPPWADEMQLVYDADGYQIYRVGE
jgi:hypothetical protein